MSEPKITFHTFTTATIDYGDALYDGEIDVETHIPSGCGEIQMYDIKSETEFKIRGIWTSDCETPKLYCGFGQIIEKDAVYIGQIRNNLKHGYGKVNNGDVCKFVEGETESRHAINRRDTRIRINDEKMQTQITELFNLDLQKFNLKYLKYLKTDAPIEIIKKPIVEVKSKTWEPIIISQDDLICTICLCLQTDYMTPSNCQHIVCKDCYKGLSNRQKCPTCAQTVQGWGDNRFVSNLVKQIKNKNCPCPVSHKSEDCPKRTIKCKCEWKGAYIDYIKHRNIECKFRIVGCVNKDCDWTGLPDNLGNHIKIDCSHTYKLCCDCNTKYRGSFENHECIKKEYICDKCFKLTPKQHTCDYENIKCEWCKMDYPLKERMDHYYSCPDKIVSCLHVNCAWHGPIKCLEAHLHKGCEIKK